ncbi:hypothetical protein FHW88_003379 [Mucilaginibacter sp. SG538B]|uniref:DUF5712 family protein n=1 Tax=Mucilaginibacter sp. SG538B TaxID=2587021 RepID=UPI00159E2BE4|nr:DUF5712 family protein [Mucilaginibacter sp. SG538B]NVM65075.1 hypothetical protein [Mucilaginibacter sp. SG538B]
MYINITDSESGNNKGGSKQLVHYLDKENRLLANLKPEQWFNGTSNAIPSHKVGSNLDNNIAKLGRDDAKFFLINISPSQKEIAWLKSQYGEDGAKEMFKIFAIGIMDKYAKNFDRPGIESNNDLLWFGKLENHRYYSHKDPEVKQGLQKRGDVKPGEQMHIQVIVSRKDITNKIKLSPMNKSRGKNAEHSKKVGQFDRSAFKASGEQLFDSQFKFKRDLKDTFRYANAQKNGNPEQRMAARKEYWQTTRQSLQRSSEQKNKVTAGLLDKEHRNDAADLLQTSPDHLLSLLLDNRNKGDGPPLITRKKGKRRKGFGL